MNVALVNPPFLFPDRKQIAASHCLGLRSVSAALKAAGHDVTFIDALRLGFGNVQAYPGGVVVGLSADETVRHIPAGTELVGIGVPFSQLAPLAHGLAAEVKRQRPGATVVLGGVYPSTQPSLALSSEADHIVVGEGERAICDLAGGMDPATIPGVFSPTDAGSDLFACAAAVEDLDALPRPDDTMDDLDWYLRHSPRGAAHRKTVSIITSRGCPFACEFCSIHPVYGRKWRAMSAGRVLEDVAWWVAEHGVRAIEIEDDNFTLDADRARAILQGFETHRRNGVDLTWSAPNGVRLDTLNDELIALIGRSGCDSLSVALEHGDAEMLKIMNKSLDLSAATQTIGKLAAAGLRRIIVFVIVGYPGETRQRFDNSLAVLRELAAIQRRPQRIAACVNIAQPYPGTQLLQRCIREGIIDDPQFGNFLARPHLLSTSRTAVIETADFDAAEVLRRQREIYAVLPDAGAMVRGVRRAKRALRMVLETAGLLAADRSKR